MAGRTPRPGSPGINGTMTAKQDLGYKGEYTTTGNREGVAPTKEVENFKISPAGIKGGSRIHNPVANYPVINR